MPKRSSTLLLGALAVALAAAPAGLRAEGAPDKAAIEKIVRDYLLANPEVIAEAMQALEKKQADAQAAEQKALIKSSGSLLFDSSRQVVLGNPKGDVTVVEFFDYNCGYCKRALGDMLTLLDKDPNIRIVLKEFPVLGPGSTDAAKIAVAVNRIAPDKYLDFHKRLLGIRGQADKAKALEAATAAGVPAAELDRAIADKETAATLEEVYGLAGALGLSGTPSYVIGEEVIPGAIGFSKLQARIAEARCTATKKC
ncbi:MAG: DsbA family protein [Hyphomicrobiales bacterium]|nr:DsbA family protein [Hyphomicrobiales bacterium]